MRLYLRFRLVHECHHLHCLCAPPVKLAFAAAQCRMLPTQNDTPSPPSATDYNFRVIFVMAPVVLFVFGVEAGIA